MKKLMIFTSVSLAYSALLIVLTHLGLFSFGKLVTYNFHLSIFTVDFILYVLMDIGWILLMMVIFQNYQKHTSKTTQMLHQDLKIGYLILFCLYIFGWILSIMNIDIVIYLSIYLPLMFWIIGVYTIFLQVYVKLKLD